jgi:Cu/Ag efflux protein CusF
MFRKFGILSAFVVMFGMIPGPASVQAQQSMPGSTSTQAGASLEGTVKKVDPGTSSVEVSIGKFGLWAKTLEVSNDTEIRVEGRKASLEDLHEGEKVKASYETRVGKSFATSIDVMPVPEPGEAPGQAGPKTQ